MIGSHDISGPVNFLFDLIRPLEMISHAGATGHALRRIFVTTLANDLAVSTEAGMEASRHTSVSAYREYQVVGKTSEAAKFATLGLEKK